MTTSTLSAAQPAAPRELTTPAEALAAAAHAFAARNPKSARQYELATGVMPGGNTRSVLFYEPFPLAMTKGEGCRLWDADSHEYLDFIAEFSAGIYGHSDPQIRRAIDAALDDGLNLSGHNLLESRLAKAVCERFTSLQSVRFTNSGTEANLMMLAAARAFTGRSKVVVFVGGYHGGVLTFGRGPNAVNVPHEFLYARYNDVNSVARLLHDNPSEVAAILVEPMQGASGCIVGDRDFLKGLRELATAHGALLMFDEVMTSRLAPGGLQSTLEIVPDLTSLGKYIGGGMSFGAFGGRADIMQLFDPRRSGALQHAGTFNNNVMTMAAGFTGLTQVYTPEAALALTARGDTLRDALNARFSAANVALRFIGVGSLMNLQITDRPVRSVRDIDASLNVFKDLFFFHLLENGIYIARRGYVVLSLPVGDAETARFEAAVASFIERYGHLLPKSKETDRQ
ncbi:aspartate aminotransferase family protein [Paraburkholderia sabiae]|uniref:Aminotransferase class III-fold pyridoxal phosphate-dependent enzyme n=1 Tax=Paraburkholderia sabiae TaxID=273251 RepID=A0ABU9QLS3_9BURK|nr:aminotransferase class III-fold pyridoxal phosphate-dependent enzyme [Paraburkholderia sabiae]WJZ77344.1 aminotransferase class III-fold pyridoxal phosphate-dependent enzyme [Paraburkholderia sabiae]CAD6547737.1 Beta-phenylalanine transaminase [Paraburkholderia sabiae]